MFDDEHEQLFTFKLEDGHEILMIRAVAKARTQAIAEIEQVSTAASLQDCVIHQSKFYYAGAWHEANIVDRNKLHQGLEVAGPAIVSEMDSTTVILPGYLARIDAVGNLLINPVA